MNAKVFPLLDIQCDLGGYIAKKMTTLLHLIDQGIIKESQQIMRLIGEWREVR